MINEYLKSFEKDSYIVLKDFFPANIIQKYKGFIEENLSGQVEQIFKKWKIGIFEGDCFQKAEKLLANDKTVLPNERQVLLGQFPIEVRLSKEIYPLAEFVGKSELIRQILGSESLFMHMPPMIRFVPKNYNHAAVPPHQDISYNRHMSDFITVWVPLVPINDRCGGLIMYEGSQEMPEKVKESQELGGDWLPPIEIGNYKRNQLVDLDIGDVVVLSPYIAHESAPNFSDNIRLSMDLRIFSDKSSSSKHYLDLQTLQTIAPEVA